MDKAQRDFIAALKAISDGTTIDGVVSTIESDYVIGSTKPVSLSPSGRLRIITKTEEEESAWGLLSHDVNCFADSDYCMFGSAWE